MKKILFLLLTLLSATSASFAQSQNDTPTGTLSPYSQFGIGQLVNPVTGYNAAMEGVALGMRDNTSVNPQNPASYSAVDSLTFIFDAGANIQFTNYKQGAIKLNRTSGDIDYVTALFRVHKGVGVSFGVQPISQVGYDYTESGKEGGISSQTTYHARHGGLQQYFVGAGWQPLKYLAVGMNFAYLHGEITRNVAFATSESDATSYTAVYNTNISSYKFDFGVQGIVPLGKKDMLTIGATFTPGHKLGADLTREFTDSKEGTYTKTAPNAFAIPNTFAAGVAYTHGKKWTVAADYSLQKWAETEYPEWVRTGDGGKFVMQDNYYRDRTRIALGGEYCANPNGRSMFELIRYRAGFSYTSPYYNIKQPTGMVKGPKELAVSAGFSLPIINGYNNRSVLNIAAQWVNTDVNGLIRENSFRVKVGLTFNERWFMKWKVE